MDYKRKKEILHSVKSPYQNYCAGHRGQSSYVSGVVIGTSSAPKEFSHKGSTILDHINVFDLAEIDNTNIGQINMIEVSSFCGPGGLLLGHDFLEDNSLDISLLFEKEDIDSFKEVEICHAGNLRNSMRSVFGTIDEKKFPFLPGEHVFAAKKFISEEGPANIYAAIGIGIPENREEDACLFMENVGTIEGDINKGKNEILKQTLRSVLTVGKNQRVSYKKIYVDIDIKKVKEGEYGGALVAIPYFLLARGVYKKSLEKLSLEEWKKLSR